MRRPVIVLAAALGGLVPVAQASAASDDASDDTAASVARPSTQRSLWDANGAAMFAGPAPIMLGVDVGAIRRTEGVGVRLGGGLLSTVRPMPLIPGHLAIAIPYVSAEGCATVDDQRLVFRVCGGPLVGATVQRWQGFEHPGPRRRAWVAARLGAQYGLMMGRDVGLSLGMDFTVPIVSPHYRSRGAEGEVLDQRKSRPIGYMLRVGVAFRGRGSSCGRGCSLRSTAPADEAS
ncbi:MAG: hypothetical protein KDK70_32065 [Myxococcales bacterium]|nr:hypothetical protein [Myxococcales bacterium]